MKTQIDLLSALPVRILKQINQTKSNDKKNLTADLAFSIEFSGIVVTESVLDSDFLVFKYNGEKVGAVDVRRGRQEFQLPSGEWSTDWEAFLAYLIIGKRAIASRLESAPQTLEDEWEAELDKVASDYEDATDQSMTDAQRLLVHAHGTIGERLLTNLDERFEVEIVENRLEITDTTTNRVVLVEYNREAGTWMGYQSNGQMWAVTGKPNHHLELITKGFI